MPSAPWTSPGSTARTVSVGLLVLDWIAAGRAAAPTVCRRWAHMSAQGTTANGSSVLYLYGGEASSSQGQRSDLWTNALYSFDLGLNYSAASSGLVSLSAETANAGSSASASPPAVALGSLFALNGSSNTASPLVVYGGEWSDTPFVNPSSVGITSLLSSPPSTQPLPPNVFAAAEAASAWDPLTQRGWVHGGQLDVHTQPGWSNQVARVYLSSLLEFDFAGGAGNPKVTNSTSDRGPMADHTMTFLPAAATNTSDGLLVILGGALGTSAASMVLAPMDSIYVYDIGAQSWTTVSTKTVSGGATPQQRVNHCAAMAVGSVNGVQTWQIYINGGQTLDQSVQYSDTWVLSSPDYTWAQVADASTASAPAGRAGHTCNLDGSQLIVIGGFAASRACESPGLYVLDVPQVAWSSSFTTGTTYSSPPMLNAVLGGTAVGGSSQSALGGVAGSGVSSSPNAPAGSGTDSGSGGSGGSGTQTSGGTPNNGGAGEGHTGSNGTTTGSGGSKTGLIAGLAVAAVVLIAILGYGYRRYRKMRRGEGTLPAWAGRGHYRFTSDASSVNSSIYQRYDPDAAAVAGNPYSHVQTTQGNADSAKFGAAVGAAAGRRGSEQESLMMTETSSDPHNGTSRRPIAAAAGLERSSGDSTPRPSNEADVADPLRMYGGGIGGSQEPSTPSSGATGSGGMPVAAKPQYFRTTSDFAHGAAWIHQTGSSSRLAPAPMLRITNASGSDHSHGSHSGSSSADFYNPEGPSDWEQFNPSHAATDGGQDPRVLRVANPGNSQFSLSNRTYNSAAATTSHEGGSQSSIPTQPPAPVALPSGARYIAPSVISRAGHSSTSGSRRSNSTMGSTRGRRSDTPLADDESEDYMWRR